MLLEKNSDIGCVYLHCNRCMLPGAVQLRFVDGEKWWVKDNGPIKSLTDLWDGMVFSQHSSAPFHHVL